MDWQRRVRTVAAGVAVIIAAVAAPAMASSHFAAHAAPPKVVVSIGHLSAIACSTSNEVLSLPITLDRPSNGSVDVDFKTESGTAVAGTSFVATSGTVRLRAGSLGATVHVTVLARPTDAPPAAFDIRLSRSRGASLGNTVGTVQLLGTGGAVLPHSFSGVGVGDIAIYPGVSGGTRFAVVPVTLTARSSTPIRVVVATGNDTATAGMDFVRRTSHLTFRPGTVVESALIPVNGATGPVSDRQFLVRLTSSSGAVIVRKVGHVTLLAASPSAIVTSLSAGLSAIPLSADRSRAGSYDTFSVVDAGGVVTSSAAATNTGGNTRLLMWPSGEAPTTDQQSCVTLQSQTPPNGDVTIVQEGVSLRVSTVAGVTRAITVLKNVFGFNNSAFLVALWDTQIPKYGFHGLGVFNLSAVLGKPTHLVPFPWRMCARAVADTVQFKVWPLKTSQPAWGDTRYGATVTIPPQYASEWDAPGVAGWYIGHLDALQSATYTQLHVEPLTVSARPHRRGALEVRRANGEVQLRHGPGPPAAPAPVAATSSRDLPNRSIARARPRGGSFVAGGVQSTRPELVRDRMVAP